MIIDQLKNASMYYAVSPRLERALRYLEMMDLEGLAPDRYEIAGDQVFAMVQEYDSKRMEEGLCEAHRNYIDVQYVVSGAEKMGYAATDKLTAGEYDGEKDFLPLEGEGEFLELTAGTFVILGPQDAHMPGMAIAEPTPVKKVVVKVLI